MLSAGLTSAIGYWTSYQGQRIYCRCFRSVLSYLKQFQLTALHNAQYVGVQRSQQSAKVSFAKTHSANQTCVVHAGLALCCWPLLFRPWSLDCKAFEAAGPQEMAPSELGLKVVVKNSEGQSKIVSKFLLKVSNSFIGM